MEVVIHNVILGNEFEEAKINYYGVPKYPVDLFIKNNNFNSALWRTMTEILTMAAEVNGILQDSRTKESSFLQGFVQDRIEKVVWPLYSRFSDPMVIGYSSIELVDGMKNDFEPNKLIKFN